tara:strand:+ start:800 stop:1876 length:1077 start_codon:yes stop_codon:yes gene_type:complete
MEILGTESVNASTNLYKCADRVSPGNEPKDITFIKEMYIPFDVSNKAVHLRKNPFGVVIYRANVKPGNIYQAFDGRRLVVEVGCRTVIYIHINPSQPSRHHRVFIQSESAFSGDTTIRRDAAIIAKNTQHIETIVKYEMFFILGVLSTASLSAWLMVTGADVSVMYAHNVVVGKAAKKLVNTLFTELAEVKAYAPVLHQKIVEMIIAEGEHNAVGAVKTLPETIVKDEKVQAQVAGIIFGKWAMPNGNPFNLWTVISVVLTQAAVKSVTKYGDAYLTAIDSRYQPIISEMKTVNPANKASLEKPARSLVALMREAGVSVTTLEANTILAEISTNSEKAFKNLTNVTNAIIEFKKVAAK